MKTQILLNSFDELAFDVFPTALCAEARKKQGNASGVSADGAETPNIKPQQPAELAPTDGSQLKHGTGASPAQPRSVFGAIAGKPKPVLGSMH